MEGPGMVNTWFVMIPPSYADKSTAEKELVDFVIQFPAGSQAWNDANAGRELSAAESNTGSAGVGEQLVKWLGPYATQAEAKTAANPQQQSLNPASDFTNAAENSNGILGIPASIGQFFAALGQSSTWIRVAKVIIGGALVIIGLAHMTGADNTVASTARRIPLPI